MLTGKEIAKQIGLGRIRIEPFNLDQCQPTSYDYRLENILRILRHNSVFEGEPCIDPRKPQEYREVAIPESGYLLRVGECYIGTTVEKFGSDYYTSEIGGKSSTGRIFITNHNDAPHIDPGFFGNLTLEITAKKNTLVFPGMLFGQIYFFETVGELELYRGKYQGSKGAEPSRIHLDLNKK